MILKKPLKLFLYFLLATSLLFSFLIFKIYNKAQIDEARIADAIIVLGASQWNSQPSPVLKARLDHAWYLYQNNYARQIILTGGVGKGERISESQVGKNYLLKKGLEAHNVFIEEKSHTSWQSLQQAVRIAAKQNFNSVILVSDGFHLMRLKKMMRDLKVQAYASPAQKSPIHQKKTKEFKYVLREVVVYILYLLFKV